MVAALIVTSLIQSAAIAILCRRINRLRSTCDGQRIMLARHVRSTR